MHGVVASQLNRVLSLLGLDALAPQLEPLLLSEGLHLVIHK